MMPDNTAEVRASDAELKSGESLLSHLSGIASEIGPGVYRYTMGEVNLRSKDLDSVLVAKIAKIATDLKATLQG